MTIMALWLRLFKKSRATLVQSPLFAETEKLCAAPWPILVAPSQSVDRHIRVCAFILLSPLLFFFVLETRQWRSRADKALTLYTNI